MPFSLAFLFPLLSASFGGLELGEGAWVSALLPWLFGQTRRNLNPKIAWSCGALLYAVMGQKIEELPVSLQTRGPVVLEATVADAPLPLGRGALILLAAAPPLELPGPAGPELLPGARIEIVGRIEGDPLRIKIPAGCAPRLIRPAPWWRVSAAIARARSWVRGRLGLGRGLTANATALSGHLRTLLLGERALPRGFRRLYAQTGTLHLFAVSGLHLTLLLTLLERSLGRRSRWLIPPLILYATLTGFRSPVGRAVIIVLGQLGARQFKRRRPRSEHLLFAATILLALRPRSLHEIGFQLSFASYAGIQLLALPWMERRQRDPLRDYGHHLPRPVESALIITTGAFLFGLPFSIHHFHQIAPICLLGSLLLAPLVPPLLLLALLWLAWPGSPLLSVPGEGLIRALRLILQLLEGIPFGHVWIAAPPLGVSLLYAAALLWLVRALHGRRGLKAPSIPLAIAIAAHALPSPPQTEVILLPARRGTALLLGTERTRWLIDTGPARAHIASRILGRGIGRLDGVIISHLHSDHVGGLPAIREKLRVDEIHGSWNTPPLTRGWRCRDGALCIEALWPPPNSSELSTNDRSCALLIEHPFGRILSLGDIESVGLEALLAKAPLPTVRYLVLPHHGSRNRALLNAILESQPRELWIPAIEGFPDESTELLAALLGLPIRQTKGGTVAASPR